MRKVVLQFWISLDGYSCDEGTGLWQVMEEIDDPEQEEYFAGRLRQAGTHIGRVTYQGMARTWPVSSHPVAAPMNDIPKVVFSKTLKSADWPETRIARGDTADEIARLRAEPGGEILARGGTQFVRSLIRYWALGTRARMTRSCSSARSSVILSEHELEMRLGHPDATVGDLAAVLGCPGGVCIDGRAADPVTSLTESGLMTGSVVTSASGSPGRPAGSTTEQPAVAVLRLVGGIGAGLSVPLRPGRVRLGRVAEADVRIECPAVSRLHCEFEVGEDGRVEVTDLGSRNGTDLNGARLTGTARAAPRT